MTEPAGHAPIVAVGIVTLPNILTLIRLIGLPVYCLTFHKHNLFASVGALAFLLLTDYFDGWSARRLSQQTHFGSIFDPICDRITTAFVYVWMAWSGWDWWWLAAIVAVRHVSQMLSVPILIWWLKRTFYVRVRALPKWVTAYNSLYLFYPLYFKPFVPEGIELGLHLALTVPMAIFELKILSDYLPRLVAIARGKHDTFE